jgi:glycosyltransferase involved in cell wall biosynthesis
MSALLASRDSLPASSLGPARRVVFFLQGERVPAARARGHAIVAGLRRAGAFRLIQYMALGLAGLASPVSANSEVVTHGVDGFFASTDHDWEQYLVYLIDGPDLRASIGARARHRIVEAYSVEAVIPKYLEVLGQLI